MLKNNVFFNGDISQVNFGLTKFFFIRRPLSMRQKTKNHRNQGVIDKKRRFIFPVPKSPTQIGSLSVKYPSQKFSRLDTFKAVSCVSLNK
jgi:hypothetical protein